MAADKSYLIVHISRVEQLLLPAEVTQLAVTIKLRGNTASTRMATPSNESGKYSGASYEQRLFLDGAEATAGTKLYFALESPASSIPLAKFTMQLDENLLNGRPVSSSVPLFVQDSSEKWVQSDANLYLSLCKAGDPNVDPTVNAVSASPSVPTRVLGHTVTAVGRLKHAGQLHVDEEPGALAPHLSSGSGGSPPAHGAGCTCRFCTGNNSRAGSAVGYGYDSGNPAAAAVAARQNQVDPGLQMLLAENTALRQQIQSLSMMYNPPSYGLQNTHPGQEYQQSLPAPFYGGYQGLPSNVAMDIDSRNSMAFGQASAPPVHLPKFPADRAYALQERLQQLRNRKAELESRVAALESASLPYQLKPFQARADALNYAQGASRGQQSPSGYSGTVQSRSELGNLQKVSSFC